MFHSTARCFTEFGQLQDRKPKADLPVAAGEREAARRNRAAGLAIALLLFVLIIYIATYAEFGA